MAIRARSVFVCSAEVVEPDTPIESTPSTTVGKKNPDRAVRQGRRVIADMRRVNVGFPTSRFYPVRVPSVEAIALLLVSMAVSSQ